VHQFSEDIVQAWSRRLGLNGLEFLV